MNLNKARMILLKHYFDEVQQKMLLSMVKRRKDKNNLPINQQKLLQL